MNIDFDRLRKDLIDYYGTAFIAGGFGAAAIEVNNIYEASNDELIDKARMAGFCLDNYIIEEEKVKRLDY